MGSLRRYTQLPALFYMLKGQCITLLDPKSWDDRNDSYYLSVYRRRRNAQTVLALCFSEEGETYHHWSVFAPGLGGVCIEFDADALTGAVEKQPGVRSGRVRYRTLKSSRGAKIAVSDLPFRKRLAFQDEKEFRVIYESKKDPIGSLDIQIPLSSIRRVVLSPWLPKTLGDEVKAVVRSIDGCKTLKVYRSTLISNEEWKKVADNAVAKVKPARVAR